ncbi:serine hydrolase domain-containing protein [Microbacterium sp.]|uniref:serine hydrolase domain-containing protein n=1 Tax=Microbacterium sp. TaxID=51671 RepID=UPI002C3BE5F9|nr:serine hydrolase domain-containing protein [Microbacterium sp.]HWK77332.1 serine hydrolase domain-containing protein [Microbacterium sp.]
MVDTLAEILDRHVALGTAPGILAVTGRAGDPLEFTAAGDVHQDAVFRIQSMTKPVLTVAALRLVQDGLIDLSDPVERWLPELADRHVLRAPDSPLSDTEPAHRSITVRDLLTNTSGFGMMTSESPLKQAMVDNLTEAGSDAVALGAHDWLDALAELPLAFHPGTGWRYHHSFGILGILLSRVVQAPLEDHLRADLFDPLGMPDTGYTVPKDQAHRLPATYRHDESGSLAQVEPAGGGFYVAPAPFDLSHAELVSTAADYAAFARMLANDGRHGADAILEPELVDQMRTDQVPASVKTDDSFFPGFWNGVGWGYGVAVETAGEHAGRYGWSGGLGTDLSISPDGSFCLVLTQVEMGDQIMGLFRDVLA